MASTAAWSAAILSPRPTRRADDSAAASVTRMSSSARLRSGFSDMPQAYLRLRQYFDGLHGANYWLPGNHDDRAGMEAAAGDAPRMPGEIRAGRWQILMLDSQVPGEVGGRLGPGELARLQSALAAASTEG